MRIAVLLSALVIAVGTVATGSNAGPIPESVIGLWGPASGPAGCEGNGRTMLVNSAGVIVFERSGSETFIVLGPAEWSAGTLILTRHAGDIVLSPLDNLTRCDRLPGQYYAFFGEAIAVFQGFAEVQSKCEDESPQSCVSAIFGLFDVSGDYRLSRAEIGRALRAGAFFLGYEAIVAGRKELAPDTDLWQTYRVPIGEIYGASLAAALLGPFFTDNLVQSYDFDADGVLSLSEILQDRGPDSLVAAGGAVGSAAAQTALQGLIGVLQRLLGIVPLLR